MRRFDTFRPASRIEFFIAQGAIADRTRERLGTSDAGIVLLRKLFREQMERIERGEDPMAVVRDPAHNRITVPREEKAFYTVNGGFNQKKPTTVGAAW